MSDSIRINFVARGASAATPLWVKNGSTLRDLRDRLTESRRMDTRDRFATLTPPSTTWEPVPPDRESQPLEDNQHLMVEGPRQSLTLIDVHGDDHVLFVEPDATLASLRVAFRDLVPPAARFRVGETEIAPEREGRTLLAGVTSLTLVEEKPAGPPPPLALLVIRPGASPKPISWQGGGATSTLAELRTFLADNAGAGPFLDAAGSAVDREMEPFETVAKLGQPAAGAPLRVRFQAALATPPDGLGGTTGGADAAAGATVAETAAARAALAERLALRETRDTLALLGGTVSSGAPAHWFDALDRSVQSALLLSFRHLHGLRFVAAGFEDLQRVSKPDQSIRPRAFELDRSIRPALAAAGEQPAVRVVVPATSTRFSAFAAETATAESTKGLLSWNAGGSLGGEGGDNAVALKASYSSREESDVVKEDSQLTVRVDYLVARGEIIVDPLSVRLAPGIVEAVRDWRRVLATDSPANRRAVRHAIVQVIEYYGAYVPFRTIFGGKLVYRQTRSLKAGDSRIAKQREAKADIEVKVRSVAAKGGAGLNRGDTAQQGLLETLQDLEVTMTGGDPALVTTPYRWADSLDHYPWWAPIGFADLRPLFSLLPVSDCRWVVKALEADAGIAEELGGPIDWSAYMAQLTAAADRGRNALAV